MTNKTALLTGGSRGIGKATAELLRARGWKVIAPTRAEFDMARPNGIYLERMQKGNAIIFCHGEWYSEKLQHPQHYRDQYEARVVTVRRVLDVILPRLAGGVVITVASTRGFIGGVETGPYALACAAQIAMMQGYSREYQGVRFNVIAPGLTRTRMGDEVVATGGAKPGAPMQPPGVVAAEIVRLIESEDNGRVMRVVNSEVTEAKWSW